MSSIEHRYECAVCLEILEGTVVSLQFSHTFHNHCIEQVIKNAETTEVEVGKGVVLI